MINNEEENTMKSNGSITLENPRRNDNIPVTSTPQSNNSMLNAFKQEFSTNVNPVFINSLSETVNFREVNVKEQKSLSKIMIENETRKDIVYDTQCALINRLALKDGFDIYTLSEFDRIRILMEIYQNNYFNHDINYKCPECGCENKYTLDFEKIIEKFNAFDLKDITYSLEDSKRHYIFTLNYPPVRNVSNFYKQYMKKYRNTSNKQREVLDNLGNIEYVNLFVRQIKIVNKVTKNEQIADLTLMTYEEIEQLISYFPQNIIFSEETGVLKYIAEEFINKINGVFNYEKCAQCGAETQEGLGSVMDFF